MNKVNLGLVTLIFSILIVTTSCNSVDKKAALVPRDAMFALHLNTGSLSSKLSWDEVKKTNWFNQISMDQKDSLTRMLLDDPGNSGMDTKEGFFVFARKENDGTGYFGFSGNVKDAAAFEAFNKKMNDAGGVTNKDDIKTIAFGERGAVNWNDSKFLYLIQTNFGRSFKMDSGRHVYQDLTKPDYHEIGRRIFNYKKDSLLSADDRFSDMMKDEGDVHFWSNAESLSTMDNPMMGPLSFLSLDVYFKETVTAASLTFDKGKITIHAKTYSNKQMQEFLKKYSGSDINMDLVQRIPSENVIGVFAANYKPEGLREFLKLGGLDGIVNSFLAEYQLTLDQVVSATKGDFLLAVSDIGTKKRMVSLGKGMDSLPINAPSANIFVVMPVNNKAPFEKLIGAAEHALGSGKMPTDVTFRLSNDLFVAGTNPGMIDQYLKGGKKDFPFLSKIKGHPIAFYLDLNRLIASMPKDSSEIMQASGQMWQDIVMTGGEFKDNAIVQNVEVNLVDQNTNSLKQLNTYFDKMSASRKRPF